jgi:hypothetical protein
MQPIIANEFRMPRGTPRSTGNRLTVKSAPCGQTLARGLPGTPETLPGAHGCQELFDLDFESVSLVRQRAG